MALVRRILGDAQAKLRKMVDEQSLMSRSPEPYMEPEPADPLITPAEPVNPRIYETIDRKQAIALDRKITLNSHLNLNSVESPLNRNGSVEYEQSTHRTNSLECFKANGKASVERESSSDDNGCRSSQPDEKNILDVDSPEEAIQPILEDRKPLDAESLDIYEKRAFRDDPGDRSSGGSRSSRIELHVPLEREPSSPRSRSSGSRQEEVFPPSPGNVLTSAQMSRRMKEENERLQAEVTRLRRLLVTTAEKGVAGAGLLAEEAGEELTEDEVIAIEDVAVLQRELRLTREAVNTLKADKKRLKAERFDLLGQMRQLCSTLEEKERELREFIRNYEQMRSRGGASSALAAERSERERERAALLRHAREEAERSLQLAAALSARDAQLRRIRDQLVEARRQLQAAGCLSECESIASLPPPQPHHDRSVDSGVRVTGSSDGGATSVCGGNLSDSTVECVEQDLHNIYQLSTPRECSPSISPMNSGVPIFGRALEATPLSRSVEQLSSPVESEPTSLLRPRSSGKGSRSGSGLGGRGSAWGSISRVFAKSRHRAKATSGHETEPIYSGPIGGGVWANEAALREASSLPMARWRAPAVLSWLELGLGMSQYANTIAENVRSGKIRAFNGQVLLELTDSNLENGLGIQHPMHRKKLRLAIEERRRPELVQYPLATHISHLWLANEWLLDIGLPQYAESFLSNLVDGRMLEVLSKRELEKYLGVTRRLHQASIVHGVYLLRLMKYDRQALASRRSACTGLAADPLVWTAARWIQWAHHIDLGEYAENLRESGVHGALVVLEPSFTWENMASCLGIPSSKSILRRHLNAEFDALVMPARCYFSRMPLGGFLSRSLATGLPGLELNEPRRSTLRGSISKALGLKWRQNHQHTNGERIPVIPHRALSQLSVEQPIHEYEPIYTPASLHSHNGVYSDLKENFGKVLGVHSVAYNRVSSPLPSTTEGCASKPPRRARSTTDLQGSQQLPV